MIILHTQWEGEYKFLSTCESPHEKSTLFDVGHVIKSRNNNKSMKRKEFVLNFFRNVFKEICTLSKSLFR